MRLDRKLIDTVYMARDFVSVVRGTGYFHQPDLIGRFFVDHRSYYIDLRGKADWQGECREGVPMLFVPSLGRSIAFPGMIIQYGLGCVDRYFETDDEAWKDRVDTVSRWLLENCLADGSFDNFSRELNSDRNVSYHSNNSAMTQGLAMSFLARVLSHGLVAYRSDIEAMLHHLYTNMMLPMDRGGGAWRDGTDLFLCEYCRTDNQVVLNGWIFAVFGLFDCASVCGDSKAKEDLSSSLATLSRHINDFIMPRDNWSRYDNLGRIASPVYQVTHISQSDALYRLTGNDVFQQAFDRLTRGNSRKNRAKYTFRKILDKLRDQHRYSSAS